MIESMMSLIVAVVRNSAATFGLTADAAGGSGFGAEHAEVTSNAAPAPKSRKNDRDLINDALSPYTRTLEAGRVNCRMAERQDGRICRIEFLQSCRPPILQFRVFDFVERSGPTLTV